MTSRLMLGCGAVGQTLASRIAGEQGGLTVITDDSGRIDALRGPNRTVTDGDPTDPELLAEAAPSADIVVLADDDAERNAAMAVTVRDVYPDAFVLAYPGEYPSENSLSTLRERVDQLIEPSAEIADHVLGFVTGKERPGPADSDRRLPRSTERSPSLPTTTLTRTPSGAPWHSHSLQRVSASTRFPATTAISPIRRTRR
ncbi:NAD-binding protein [Natronoarchaeum sp. GCM10025703]|uniref:NAD-binding protein n=1 Tax=Natronoarchaeum sp. GCM10025703 TaxID=3252685 RepID=UPI0036105FBD